MPGAPVELEYPALQLGAFPIRHHADTPHPDGAPALEIHNAGARCGARKTRNPEPPAFALNSH